jgi:hypothetical protein
MGGNLTIGLVAGSHGFSLSWDSLLLLEMFCALVHASLILLMHFFSPELHQTPNVTSHPLLLPWTLDSPSGLDS